jgi:peroxiredoxin
MGCPAAGITAEGVKSAFLAVILGAVLVTGPASALTETKPIRSLKTMDRSYAADDFTLKALNGKRVRMSGLKGKAVLLNFWATWCPPCRREMPSMERLYQRYRSRGLVILAVSLDRSSPDEGRSFVDEMGLNFTVLLDPDGLTSSLYSVSGVPFSFLIDPEGRIVYKAAGAIDWDGAVVQAAVEAVLPVGQSE